MGDGPKQTRLSASGEFSGWDEDLAGKSVEVEPLSRPMAGREERMLELKQQVNALSIELGRTPPYDDEPVMETPAAAETLDRETVDLTTLFNKTELQRVLESFCAATGVATAIIDLEGTILIRANWQRVCTDFHRLNGDTCRRCIESDTYVANQLAEGKEYSIYRCRNGMTDAASPIILDGVHVANAFIGQFHQQPPDLEAFRAQAKEFGFDEEAYLEAVCEAPVLPTERLPLVLEFVSSIARLSADMGLDKITSLRNLERLEREHERLETQRRAALNLLEDVRRTENALRDSEARLRSLSDNLPGGMAYQLDMGKNGETRQFTYVSAGVETLHELTAEAVLRDAELIYGQVMEEDRPLVAEREAEARAAMTPFAAEVRMRLPSGTMRWRSFASAPRRAPNGHLIWDGIEIDITERKSAEELHRESEARYRATIDSAADAVFLVGAENALVDVNRRACERLGYGREELLSLTVHDVFADVGEEGMESIWAAAREGRLVTREGTHRCKDGSTFPVETRLGLVRLGVSDLLVAVARDISDRRQAETERERLETQLRHSQKMEAVGQLAGGVAHDFNNLLQAILGYGELALEEAAPGSSLHEELSEVMNAAHRATALVGQLLAFSRKQVLRLEVLDLNEVVEEFAKMIRRIIGEHIALSIESEPGLKTIKADRGQVEQILMNLCVNARDAMPESGRLTVRTENAEFDVSFCQDNAWARPGAYVLLSVSDTGNGIDEETQQHIFEPFFTTKEKGKGTGLGLSTVYGIVRQHQGMIHVYSEMGLGTSFKIYLPISNALARANQDTATAAAQGGTETILLAEDDAGVRSLAKRVLERAGYTVLTACDGEEAVRLFDQHAREIGLALLDVIMPKRGGRSVFEHIRKTDARIAVLFASGYTAATIDSDFLLEEGMELIHKPYQRDELLRKVRQILDL